jgi:hypothetical protein
MSLIGLLEQRAQVPMQCEGASRRRTTCTIFCVVKKRVCRCGHPSVTTAQMNCNTHGSSSQSEPLVKGNDNGNALVTIAIKLQSSDWSRPRYNVLEYYRASRCFITASTTLA